MDELDTVADVISKVSKVSGYPADRQVLFREQDGRLQLLDAATTMVKLTVIEANVVFSVLIIELPEDSDQSLRPDDGRVHFQGIL